MGCSVGLGVGLEDPVLWTCSWAGLGVGEDDGAVLGDGDEEGTDGKLLGIAGACGSGAVRKGTNVEPLGSI